MILYEATLTTLDQVKRQIDTAEESDDDMIINFIRQASSDIIFAAQRTFVPFKNAREYPMQESPILLFDDDLLTLDELTDGYGALDLDKVKLLPGRFPAFGLELINRAYWRFPANCDTTGSITVTGWYGYNINPAKMWKPVTALDGAIDEDDEEIVVDDSSRLKILDYIKAGEEMMQVLDITVSEDPTPVHTLEVERGMMGTEAVEHDDDAGIAQYQQQHDIVLAATMHAQFLYQNRDKPGTQTIQTPEGTMVISLEAPRIIHSTVSRYTRQSASRIFGRYR